MHPITLPIAELKPALAGLGKVINPRSTLPILHHLKIERTNEGWIALTGTDLDRFVTMRLEQPAEGPPIAVLVPYDQLLQLTKNCDKNERILIEPGPEGPLIRFAMADNLGASKVKLLPVDEFPQTPRIKAESIPLPPDLRQSLHEAMDCASTDSTRYILNGTFIDAENAKANYIVATDGKHIYTANSFALPLKHSVLIPNHRFLGWKEFNNDGEWQMKADKDNLQISSRRWRFISRHIEGQYPNWRQVIPDPKDAKTHIMIDPANLETLIKLIQRLPCHDERFFSIGLEWQAGQFLLLAKETGDEPWLRVPVADIKGEGPEVTIFLNRHFLIKAIRYGLNTVSLVDSISPLRFHSKGKQMIVMPVRPESAESQPPVNHPKPRLNPVPQPPPPPERKPTMIAQSAPEETAPNGQKTTIEEAIDVTNQLREVFQNGFNLARDLNGKLKTINRDQRTHSREHNALRASLRSLQGLKI